MNTDGATKGNPGLAGGGGVVRDSRGRWINGFSRNIGYATSMTAELWALRDGLNMAVSLNYQPLIVELDSSDVIAMLTSHTSFHHCNVLLNDCRWLLSRLQIIEVRHVFREGNQVADSLANLGCLADSSFRSFVTPPSEILPLLQFDCNRVGKTRLVT